MKRALAMAFVLLGCVDKRQVGVTFGADSEGLDGFMCKDNDGGYLLDRLVEPDGGVLMASIVTDFVKLGGLPGCRTGQLIAWCATRDCKPMTRRECRTLELPTRVGALSRKDLRLLVREKLRGLDGGVISTDAPNEFVMLRVIATAQPCSEVLAEPAPGVLPEYDRTRLVGCAYSCPTLFDKVEQEVYLGFDTLENACEHGIRTCADNALKWAP